MGDLSDIEKFAELKEKGLLSEQEFAAKRREVLGVRPRRRWPFFVFFPILALALFGAGIAAGHLIANWRNSLDSGELAATEPADLDKDGIIICESPKLKARILSTAFLDHERARLELGPLRQTLLLNDLVLARRCDATVAVNGRPAGSLTAWAVMRPVRRFKVVASHSVRF
jgi:hypothetical protein